MLDEVIRELTARSNDKQMTSEGVLVWAKRVETQRAQAVILNDITESHQFDKITMAQKSKSSQDRQMKNTTSHRQLCSLLWQDPCAPTVPNIWEDMHWMWDDGPLQEGL